MFGTALLLKLKLKFLFNKMLLTKRAKNFTRKEKLHRHHDFARKQNRGILITHKKHGKNRISFVLLFYYKNRLQHFFGTRGPQQFTSLTSLT